jgi:phosphoglycerate dehydrogenase-like enzyme
MALNILVTMPFPDELLEQIRSVSSEISLSYAPLKKDESLPKSTVAVTEVLYTWTALPRPEEAPSLKWVQFHSAGIEYVMASLLAWSHHLPRMLVYQKRGIWPAGRWEKFACQELRGATLGIVGYGSIGREVARLAHGFGMRILATKHDPRHVEDTGYRIEGTGDPNGELPARIYPSAATRSMLPECDFIIISAPLTEETYHLIDRAAFKAMKPTAYLVNIARGELVDQVALIEALQKGWIAGAGLDVFELEPLPPDSPLWKMDNVILSPHVAGFTPEYDRRAIDLFTANLRRYLDGQKLINTVDCRRGY